MIIIIVTITIIMIIVTKTIARLPAWSRPRAADRRIHITIYYKYIPII